MAPAFIYSETNKKKRNLSKGTLPLIDPEYLHLFGSQNLLPRSSLPGLLWARSRRREIQRCSKTPRPLLLGFTSVCLFLGCPCPLSQPCKPPVAASAVSRDRDGSSSAKSERDGVRGRGSGVGDQKHCLTLAVLTQSCANSTARERNAQRQELHNRFSPNASPLRSPHRRECLCGGPAACERSLPLWGGGGWEGGQGGQRGSAV